MDLRTMYLPILVSTMVAMVAGVIAVVKSAQGFINRAADAREPQFQDVTIALHSDNPTTLLFSRNATNAAVNPDQTFQNVLEVMNLTEEDMEANIRHTYVNL
ncbi:hypothetical protein EJ06DRAFT_525634 [Trichodelitschia bisporula]|uniref:Uncharacterized protein n=1 Tax=Trichodelitschia bisporula TaxID=703511 RepID=A0A6G1IAI3_9PEZI|nr:hypothetical protein EJ06DRAFT_525634 [Trichodelitschia bisporula]